MHTVLTVAGSDSSGGAGIEADIKAITANGSYALTAITALTAQNTVGVEDIAYTSRAMLDKMLHANFSDIKIDVVKTGMLTVDAVEVLNRYLDEYHAGKPLVVDPVLITTSGCKLADDGTLQASISKLFQKATVITPNLVEAELILGEKLDLASMDSLKLSCKKIHQTTGCKNVLLKGGHNVIDNSYLIDILYTSFNDGFKIFKNQYLHTSNTHGTGCTLASSIAANLANNYSLECSVDAAIRYVHECIEATSDISLAAGSGKSNGPLNHFYAIPTISKTELPNGSQLFSKGHFVEFLLNHPTIKPNWHAYVHHEFVRQLGNGSLPKNKFIHFLKQDYAYLINYARVHSLSASVAPDIVCIQREANILNAIANEMELHRAKLANHGITDLSNIVESEACKQYKDYLMHIAKTGDWLDIQVALAPCLFGYKQAADSVEVSASFANNDNPVAEYVQWIEDYRTDRFAEAVELGKKTLEAHGAGINAAKTMQLVKIFADVTLLEVNFWTDALNYTDPSAE